VYLKIQFLHHRKEALSPVKSVTCLVLVDCFPEDAAIGREVDHSPPFNTEVKNAWSYTFTPLYIFMVSCLIKLMDNFAFILARCNYPWALQKAAH
jgi:hypothetical protein